MNVLHDYLHTVTDPGHVLAELTWEAVTGLLGWLIGRKLLRRHDRTHHGDKA